MTLSWKIRSVPFQITICPINVRSGPGRLWLVPICSIRSGPVRSRRRPGGGPGGGQGSGRHPWSDLFDLFKKNKSCRTRRDMQNALVIGFWEANGVEIWPFPFRSVPFRSMKRSVVFRSVPACMANRSLFSCSVPRKGSKSVSFRFLLFLVIIVDKRS